MTIKNFSITIEKKQILDHFLSNALQEAVGRARFELPQLQLCDVQYDEVMKLSRH